VKCQEKNIEFNFLFFFYFPKIIFYKVQVILNYMSSKISERKISAFRNIPVNRQGFVLLGMSKHLQQEILSRLKNQEIINLLHYLDPDEVADLLQVMNKRRRKKIIEKLSKDMQEKVEFLLKFNPKTAAGLMSLDYIEVDKESNFRDVIKIIQKHEKRTGKFPTVLVVENGFLVGELSWRAIALHRGNEKIGEYVKRVPTIKYNTDEKEVIRLFERYRHNKVVVLDEDNSILGIIFSDDILRLLRKQSASNLYDFAGVSEEEDVFDSAMTKVKYRYKWLIINLGTAFLAASVVGLFQDTISAFVLLAVYMPIVAGMGGNAGTQTLAVVVRGLALKEIEFKIGKRVIVNEMLAGAINGLINGAIVAVVALLLNKSPLLGLVVGIAMVINLVIAGFFGVIIPLLLERLGKDPASSATIFITTATDVFGFFVFLGLASLLIV